VGRVLRGFQLLEQELLVLLVLRLQNAVLEQRELEGWRVPLGFDERLKRERQVLRLASGVQSRDQSESLVVKRDALFTGWHIRIFDVSESLKYFEPNKVGIQFSESSCKTVN